MNSKEFSEKVKILLIILGFPVWFPLILSAFAVILSLYISVWAVVVSLWATTISLFAGFTGGVLYAIFFPCNKLFFVSGAVLCLGLSVFMFYGCLYLSKGLVIVTKKAFAGLKTKLINRGDNK